MSQRCEGFWFFFRYAFHVAANLIVLVNLSHQISKQLLDGECAGGETICGTQSTKVCGRGSACGLYRDIQLTLGRTVPRSSTTHRAYRSAKCFLVRHELGKCRLAGRRYSWTYQGKPICLQYLPELTPNVTNLHCRRAAMSSKGNLIHSQHRTLRLACCHGTGSIEPACFRPCFLIPFQGKLSWTCAQPPAANPSC